MTDAAVLCSREGIRLEMGEDETKVSVYPPDTFQDSGRVIRLAENQGMWGIYRVTAEKKEISVTVEQVGPLRYKIDIPRDALEGVKDGILQLEYEGDIGQAFIDGDMIHDNFCNGAVWEIGLKSYMERLKEHPLTVCITPLKKGAKVNSQSAMAARTEEVEEMTGRLIRAAVRPVYEMEILFDREERSNGVCRV